jgi:hypothetical protein
MTRPTLLENAFPLATVESEGHITGFLNYYQKGETTVQKANVAIPRSRTKYGLVPARVALSGLPSGAIMNPFAADAAPLAPG